MTPTEIKALDPSTSVVKPIILLNIILNDDAEPLEGIPSQRLVFLMQTLLRLLETSADMPTITAEILKLLRTILPALADIYGEQWRQLLERIGEVWEAVEDADKSLLLLHSSLRLYQKMKALAVADEANEDLLEAWTDNKAFLDAGLLQCLWSFSKPSEGINQPRQITAELLGRLLGSAEIRAEEFSYHLVPDVG